MKQIQWSADISGAYVALLDGGVESLHRCKRNKDGAPLEVMRERAHAMAKIFAAEYGVHHTMISELVSC